VKLLGIILGVLLLSLAPVARAEESDMREWWTPLSISEKWEQYTVFASLASPARGT
jgi:hypothetical protein